LIRRLVESLGGQPVIVLGDFNCPSGSEPYWILTDEGSNLAGLRDAHAGLDPGAGGTYHAFTGNACEGRIDWILVSRRYEPSEAVIDRRERDGRYPSDHFPVAAKLRLTAAWNPHW
jgi:endonuclease/exonuclease/phosphatase family metal-dependent hydrolase